MRLARLLATRLLLEPTELRRLIELERVLDIDEGLERLGPMDEALERRPPVEPALEPLRRRRLSWGGSRGAWRPGRGPPPPPPLISEAFEPRREADGDEVWVPYPESFSDILTGVQLYVCDLHWQLVNY